MPRSKTRPRHGGARPGAGRKPLPKDQRMRSVPLVLAPQHVKALDVLAKQHGLSRSAALRHVLDQQPGVPAPKVATKASTPTTVAATTTITTTPTTESVAVITLSLDIENNNKFVRGKKRTREHVENWCFAPYTVRKLDQDTYEILVPYEGIEDLDKQIYDLCGDIACAADDRYCHVEMELEEKATGRTW